MTDREKMLRRIQIGKFVQWELHIFLDTNPDNREALERLEIETKKNQKLVEEFECKYGPLREPTGDNNRFLWISSPWPWENEEECD